MKKVENHCVGCTDLGLHCLGSHCKNRNVEVLYCDRCGCEIEDDIDGEELCADCYDELYGKEEDE
jgi:hypothetical protein